MAKRLTKEEWRRRRRRKNKIHITITVFIMLVMLAFPIFVIYQIYLDKFDIQNTKTEAITQTLSNGTVIKAEYLTPNPYSRPQTRLKRIKGIVVHYTANPG
ncbi:MAG: N-acetylmuramoyl-L-alanine amidase, partial [Herbinix sp.]|nr:N-acetylmuramoyl-L-alanine amidase [Herbinix sp.]